MFNKEIVGNSNRMPIAFAVVVVVVVGTISYFHCLCVIFYEYLQVNYKFDCQNCPKSSQFNRNFFKLHQILQFRVCMGCVLWSPIHFFVLFSFLFFLFFLQLYNKLKNIYIVIWDARIVQYSFYMDPVW